MAALLDGNVGNDAGLTSSALVPQQMGEIIGDDSVFIGEARAAGQLGRNWLLFKGIEKRRALVANETMEFRKRAMSARLLIDELDLILSSSRLVFLNLTGKG